VPSYLVETYLGRGNSDEHAARDERARQAAEELARERADVRFAHSIYVPEDETCFFVFEAATSREAALLAARAGLDPIRVVAAEATRKENST
jgi:hypothetical protein